jgi:replicative DNA helicase
MVIFIHRYDYQGLSENPDDVGRTQIIIAKHRNGAIADIDMRFRADEVRFVDEQESLVSHADSMGVASAMNDDFPSGGFGGGDFGGGDFGGGNPEFM